MIQATTAMVLLSGGQDSAACLGWALSRFAAVETMGFSYGQRHDVELECRRAVRERTAALDAEWGDRLGEDHVVDVSSLAGLGDTALTSDAAIRLQDDGLPSTFVPGRNLVFLTYAAALAYRRAIDHIVIGVCETDYSGYPDCRDDTVKAMQLALNLGMARRFVLHTPLMWLDKGQTWALIHRLGGDDFVELVAEYSHTCYRGERRQRHPWGYGCGECPACELRSGGWQRFQEGGVELPD
jgi:7-cyano-7-deazaguanine synthase